MSNKEAITLLLKKALKKGKDNLPNTWEIDQALALFKEQPPASEFTKKAREINNTENVPKWLVRRTLGETCDRLDASEASRKELLDCLKELVDIIDSGSVMDTFTTQPAKAAIKANEQGKSGRREAKK